MRIWESKKGSGGNKGVVGERRRERENVIPVAVTLTPYGQKSLYILAFMEKFCVYVSWCEVEIDLRKLLISKLLLITLFKSFYNGENFQPLFNSRKNNT